MSVNNIFFIRSEERRVGKVQDFTDKLMEILSELESKEGGK